MLTIPSDLPPGTRMYRFSVPVVLTDSDSWVMVLVLKKCSCRPSELYFCVTIACS